MRDLEGEGEKGKGEIKYSLFEWQRCEGEEI